MNEKDFYNKVAERIRALRIRHKVSQTTLAQKLEVPRMTIVNIEKKHHKASLYIVQNIALLFNVSLDYFLK